MLVGKGVTEGVIFELRFEGRVEFSRKTQLIFNLLLATEGQQCQVIFPKVQTENGRATLEP